MLNLITRTIRAALPDLAHFLVVFGSVFITFAISGMVLFGKESHTFSSVSNSLWGCWRMLFGSFDELGRPGSNAYDTTMVATSGWLGVIWFFSFNVVVSMIL